MADTVAPMITDARADLPPYAQLLTGLTQLAAANPMPDMSDPNPLIAAADGSSTALMLGVAPSHAVAVGYQGLAHSLNLLMLGDTNAHNAFASTSNAIVTATISMLLGEAKNG